MHEGKWAAAFQRPKPAPGARVTHDPAAMLPPETLLARAGEFAPGFLPSMLQYQQVTGPRPTLRVWGKDAAAVSPRARGGFLALDPYSGKVINSDFLPGRQSTPNLFVSSFFALHMAAFGGTLVQWMYFLLGLAGAWLFYSGNLLWVESRRRKAARQSYEVPVQRQDARWLAAATVGVCLGCMGGISLTIVGGKWLYGHVDNLGAWHVGLYYAAFFASIAWAFRRGCAAAAVDLLWAAALFTLAIPLTTLLAWSFPSLGMWAHTSAASLGVDVTALVGALVFAWMARATSDRIRHGVADSVWSIK